ncbi:MAG: GGDEF domain-containing protein [Planctomycetes bacterium]|nr:GGDEF domain-containing protein [Planctomycetota bacterium]
MTVRRWLHLGADQRLTERLAEVLGGPPAAGGFAAVRSGDTAVIEVFAAASDLPGGNALSACRAIKERRQTTVYLVVLADDRYGAQLARFALADAVLLWNPETAQLVADELNRSPGNRQRQTIDTLLQRYETARAADPAKAQGALHKLLQFEREDSVLQRLQDPETGLFDGPYASIKLEEEFKRAQRFHQPLALLLLDIGAPGSASRIDRAVLAEAAGVFLNECRDIDVLARFTATTFLFLLPGTGPDGALVLARRMLQSLRERTFAGGVRLQPHAGMAWAPQSGITDRKAFLLCAEACLERARSGVGDGGVCGSLE